VINDRRQIVGAYTTGGEFFGLYHGDVLDHGTFTKIDVPGATGTQAFGIRRRRQIVDRYSCTRGLRSFLFDDGTFTTIDVPGAGYASGINDRGQIVGVYHIYSSFLLDHGTFTTIDVPGASFTEASGINNRGQIVGDYFVGTPINGTRRGFVLDHGTFTTIDAPGAGSAGTLLSGINDRGDIVGNVGLGSAGQGFILN